MFSTKKDLYKYLLVMGISTMVVFSLYSINTSADKINHGIPKEYYQNKQLGYVFHWLRDRSIKSTYFLLFGNFRGATVSYSLTKPKLNFKYRDNIYANYALPKEKNDKVKYELNGFLMKKIKSNQYQIKLAVKNNHLLPQKSGKTYIFTKVRVSPAKQYANKYSEPIFVNYYANLLSDNVNKQYQKALSGGKQVTDPKTDPVLQQRIKAASQVYAQRSANSLADLFNTGFYKK
ncbi:hypothetical protein HCC74_11790 (plasmid) [Lentilactobacillus parabuchneri]|uniref:hypothetical protein n=1 Tax=Lentilactobacillus parabuchneri TaxID=152331 RepID=UPI00186605E9|nr:hypothetical protein [Lentilactobacillus parabuchneri]QOP51739.1 hypothetical protein HCC74_11790 [Lentilactobacillus parabuchneri]